ncbi:RING finger protein 17 isoform X2 [Cephus cinctus]|uniref:RING finger protein 17 isoform X2 n=1 Tax=Cephus cinctus TaxID=211228 RepID=A0AAJ7RRK6_CEPCN|nr:RING finger protein 17 isoform X2 [Cephus cinctus]
MKMKRFNKQEVHKHKLIFPTAKRRNISCVQCKHPFFVRDFCQLQGSLVPLLLSCGHPICEKCSELNVNKICPLCKIVEEKETKSNLQLNAYVMGLIGFGHGCSSNDDDPDITFQHPVGSRHRQTQDQDHSSEYLEYYCTECNKSICPHCAVNSHNGHKIIKQEDKNAELLAEFTKAQDKVAETMQRVHQVQKKLKSAQVFPDVLQNSAGVEASINQHFCLLHGVLQNVEKELVDKLYGQRHRLRRNLKEIENELEMQEDVLHSWLLMAASVKESLDKVNLKKVIEQLHDVADVPCHLIQDPISEEDTISLKIDESIIKAIKTHCQIHVPQTASFKLSTVKHLPDDYQIEPVNQEEVQKIISITEPFKKGPPAVKKKIVPVQKSKSNSSELTKGSCLVAKATYIKDPTSFYVMPMSNSHLHSEVRKNIQIMKLADIDGNNLTVSKLYAVQSLKDQNWNRGRLVNINIKQEDFTTCDIYFIDYGNTEKNVPVSNIQELSPRLLAIPPLVIKCALFDIVPKDGLSWHHDARNEMYRIIKGVDRMVNIHIVDVVGDTYQVEMCTNPSSDGTESVSIRDFLLFLGFGNMISRQTLQKTNPQSIRKYYSEDLPLEKYHTVICKCVLSPQLFYVQKADKNIQYLEKLKDSMTNFFETEGAIKGIIHIPSVGMPCAAPYTDKKWYRCRVCSIPGDKIVEVFYVDYGYTRAMRYDVIRKIPSQFMTCATQAIQVSLKDIESLNEEQNTSVVNYMKQHLCNTRINLIALGKTQYSYEVVIFVNGGVNFKDIIAAHLMEKPFVGTTQANENGPKVCKKRRKKQQHALESQKALLQAVAPNNETLPVAECDSNPFTLAVDVVLVESPDSIYLTDSVLHQEYLKVQEEMQHYYNKTRTIPEEVWKEGSSAVVYSALDKRYCRVKILNIMSDDTAEVFFYDLGIREVVPIENLDVLHPKFEKTPSNVFKAKLFGILPCGGTDTWPSYSCTKLKEVIEANQTNKFYIEKMANSDKDDTVLVDLYIKQCKTDGPFAATKTILSSVTEMLIEEGVVLPDREKMGRKKKVLAVEFRKELRQKQDTTDIPDIEWLLGNVHNICLSNDNSRSNSPGCTEDSCLTSRKNVPLPPKMASWLPAVPIQEDEFIGIASYVDYEGAIYLHSKKQNKKTLKFIENTLKKEYEDFSLKSYDRMWTVGDICIAQYHDNKMWYRGVVKKLLPNDIIQVMFVDYGNVEDCEIGTLTKRVILGHIPIQCTKCYVDSLKPNKVDGKWETDDLDRIHALTVDNELKVKIIKRYPDYNIISINLLHPKRKDLISYLVNDLHVDINTNKSISVESSESKSNCENLDITDDVAVQQIIMDSPIDEHEKCSMDSSNSDDVSDVVILGTDSGSSDSSTNIRMEQLEALSWMNMNCSQEQHNDFFVASTPQDESLNNSVPQYESLTIPQSLTTVPLRVVYVAEFPVFFAHINTTTKELRKPLDAYVNMHETMQTEAKEQPILQDVEPNIPCCTKWNEEWYRCLIIDCKSTNNSEDDTVKVRFVDFGNEDYIIPLMLHSLKEEWLQIPIVCFKFRVCNIEPISPSPKQLCAAFSTALENKIVIAKILDQYDDTYDIELYMDAECQKPFGFESIMGDGLIRNKSKIITEDKAKAD